MNEKIGKSTIKSKKNLIGNKINKKKSIDIK